MPDNIKGGELEDFIEKMMPENDPVWPMAGSYVDNIPEENRKFKPKKILKAQIHAWLATRSKPRKMGEAIRTNDLNSKTPLATKFVGWLNKLFE